MFHFNMFEQKVCLFYKFQKLFQKHFLFF